jgi:pimeloyl-ACP methyl ester carboxylesterase
VSQAHLVNAAIGVTAGLLLSGPAGAAEWPDDCQEAMLPSDDPDYPDAQLILTCLPPNFNGTLIIYAHGYVRPQEPLALPEEFANADVRELIGRLLDLGFGVATSSFHKNGYAVEQAEADLNDLVDEVRLREPGLEAVYLAGASEGGLIATMLIEKYPETYAGGLAMCAPLAGIGHQIEYLADVRVLFDHFYPEVFPFGTVDVPDDAHQQWEGPDGYEAKIGAAIQDDPDGIAEVFDVAGVTCDASNPAEAANCAQNILAYSVFGTNDLLETAGGWPVSNAEKEYQRSSDDAALDAAVERFDADPAASAYVREWYQSTGSLQRPLVTLHTTRDPGVPYRHELIYFNRAALRNSDDLLTVLPVDRAGHCEFTAPEILGGLAALLFEADSDLVLVLVEHLDTLQDVVDVTIDAGERAGRLAELVREQASDFVDAVEDEFGFLEDPGDATEDGLDAVNGIADFGGNAAESGVDTVTDVADEAKDKIEDLF